MKHWVTISQQHVKWTLAKILIINHTSTGSENSQNILVVIQVGTRFPILKVFPVWLSTLRLFWEIDVEIQKSFLNGESLAEWSHYNDFCDIVLYHHSLLVLWENSLSHEVLKKGDITDQSRNQMTPTSKTAIAKYFLSICEDNPYLTFPSKYFG